MHCSSREAGKQLTWRCWERPNRRSDAFMLDCALGKHLGVAAFWMQRLPSYPQNERLSTNLYELRRM